MKKSLALSALLALSACDSAQEPARSANKVEEAAPATKAEVPKLDGSWKVTMIGGSDARAIGMTATLANGRATLSTDCFRRAWSYSQQRNMIEFTSSPSGSSNCGGQAPGGTEESAYSAVDDANLVIFGKAGAEATLSGTGGTLTLERR